MIAIRRLSDLDAAARKSILTRPGVLTPELQASVATIVRNVRERGDAALRDYSQQWDKVTLDQLEVTEREMAAAQKALSDVQKKAIEAAYERVRKFHLLDAPNQRSEFFPSPGVHLGKVSVPYAKAGIYVPGGSASYPTCVIMNAVPATVAGIRDVTLCTPPRPDGTILPAVLYAALISGVSRTFKIGGAQAIAAMACGTASVPRVEIVVGPGNKYVTAAKKLLSDDVAIDFLAGPTELLIVSDGTGRPAFIAADLIAQAEHDPAACTIFITTKREHAEAVGHELTAQLPKRERRDIAGTALSKHGAILVADNQTQAMEFANEYGPEHLSILTKDPMATLRNVRHAGAVFLGEYSPVASGDYCVGPNSTLPTLGEARRRSGLNVSTFLKSITFEYLTAEGLASVAPMAGTLADLESLEGHKASIEIRSHGH